MEVLLKEIKKQIEELSKEDNIQIYKLRDLIGIYSRLKGYTTTSISQVNQINQHVEENEGYGIPELPVLPPRNETSMMIDLVKEYLLKQTKNPIVKFGSPEVSDYIWWYRFIDEKESKFSDDAFNSESHEKSIQLRINLYGRVLELIDRKLKEDIEQENKKNENIESNIKTVDVIK